MSLIAPHSGRVHVRLEHHAGKEPRFWEISVSGASVKTRYGRVGSDGQVSGPRHLASAEQAVRDAEKRIAAKLSEGYVRIGDPGEHLCEPALIQAIADAPDDEDGYLVYADWLQSRGDPRGDWIMIEHTLRRKPHDRKLITARRQLRREHGARMNPTTLTEVIRNQWGRDPHRVFGHPGHCALEWELGFIRRAQIARGNANARYTVRQLVAELLAHPSAQLLDELVIGQLAPEGPQDYQDVIDEICDAAPASLRSLRLVYGAPEVVPVADLRLGRLSGLGRSVPRLTRLYLCAGSLELGALQAPSLRVFMVQGVPLADRLMHDIDAAHWPSIDHIILHGTDQAIDMSGLTRTLSGEGVGELRRLTITNTTETIAIWRALAGSRLLDQLEVVDLSCGDLCDDDVAEMLAHAPRFSGLRRLNLDGNRISREYRAEVRRLCGQVSLFDQRGPASDVPIIGWDHITEFSPDSPSIIKAGDYANPHQWIRLGVWETTLWGRCRGTDVYDVFVDVRRPEEPESGCTCPSAKYPCKHALALMMLAERRQVLPVSQPPPGFIEGCRASRYDDAWE